jgi:cell division protease FtsH
VAQELLNKEVIFQKDLERLLGKRPFDKELIQPIPIQNNDTPLNP